MSINPGKIKYEAHFGDEVKTIELSQSYGAGGSWHLYIGGYYWGKFVNYQGVWTYTEIHLETEEIQICIEMIKNYERGLSD